MAEHYDFTPEDVAEEVRKLAQEHPERVYRPSDEYAECSYVTGAQGFGCIVGQAVQRLGVPEETLASLEARFGAFGVTMLMSELTGREPRDVRTPPLAWLGEVQERQDKGYSWALAVKAAPAGEES